jgi:hypothetical protein
VLRRPTDFFSLSLPAETRAYVPKLIALARLVRDPGAYGLYVTPIPDAPYFRVVPTDGPVDLRLMAELAGVDNEELIALNPAWNRWMSDPEGPHRMLIPEVVADDFSAQLAALTFRRARAGSAHGHRRRVHRRWRPLQGAGVLPAARQRRRATRAAGGP